MTVTRADLTEAVYQEVGLSRNESAQLVESILEEIASTLSTGESVKVSSFGTFSVRDKAERIGRNPKTGEEVPILPRKVLVFRASHVLKSRVDSASPKAAEDDSGEGMPGTVAEPTASPFFPGPGRGGDGGHF